MLYQQEDSNYKDLGTRAFVNTELAVPESPEREPKDKLTSNSEPDWINLAWERINKGKEKAPSNILKCKKDIGSIWVEVYRDIYIII